MTMKDFRKRLDRLRECIAALEPLLNAAEGYPAKTATIDWQVAKFFEEFITWELDHPEAVTEALIHNEICPGKLGGKPVKDAAAIRERISDERFAFHIDHELTGAMALLARAKAALAGDRDWPAGRELDWSRLAYEEGYFRIDGRPAFTGGFNFFGKSGQDNDAFMQTMQRLGIGVVSSGAAIPMLLKADGSVDAEQIGKIVESIRERGRGGFKVNFGFGWPKNAQVLDPLWPGITEHDGNFFGLDIDHPGMKEMILRVMPELMPALMALDEIVTWDMANEPFFEIKDWGPHALTKYRAWLAGRYMTIERLNDAWESSYSDFAAVPHPNEVPRSACSAGEWHDRVTFNSTRVASFFELVSGEIRRYIPDALIHLKGQDNNSLGPMPNAPADGIDREMLSRATRLQGVDTRPLPVTEPRMAAQSDDPVMSYDESPYGLHWLGQSFLYDYLTDLNPRQPVVDFEYHAFSINAIRVPDMSPDHARATLWLAHLHGLIGNWVWYWHRRSGGDPFPTHYLKLWFYGSISTQPLLAASYFRTMLELNTQAEAVEALVTQPERPVRLLVSKPSYNQDGAHIAALHRAYEGLCFHGLRVGFTTEQMLIDGGLPDDCRRIILPDVEFIDERALGVLEEARKKGVGLTLFGGRRPMHTPHGKPHAQDALAFLTDIPAIGTGTAQETSDRFRCVVSEFADELELRVNVAGADDSFGVMHRQAWVNGHLVLLLVNVSAGPLTVEVRDRDDSPVSGYDELAREPVDGAGTALPLLGVRLIRVPMTH